jgi:glucans biosynthesis protein
MFWRGENSRQQTDDFRPEVHDSDGLSILTGANEWIWRPLSNPKELRVMSFADDNPRGFGLLQRDRDFFHYEDLEANYQSRPSAWVEPVGAWGKGCVRLVEIPTANEFSDNMVAFWVPEAPVVAGMSLEFEYRIHWSLERTRSREVGFATATRLGRSTAHEPDLERIALDFDGAGVRPLPASTPPEPVMWVGDGAKLTHVYVQKIPASGAWRVMASVKADGTGRPVEMRCFLRREGRPLTETWSYLWQP